MLRNFNTTAREIPGFPHAHNFLPLPERKKTTTLMHVPFFFAKSDFKDKNILWTATGLLALMGLFFSSCGVYSFTGASVPAGTKTMSIQYFTNKAAIVEPTLSNVFTNALRDRFTSQTNLKIVPKNGDINIEGEITGYAITPQAIQGDQTAALNRLTITVNVRYTSKQDPTKDFETTFSKFRDYSSIKDFNSVKADLIKQIVDDLTDDIFNKALANW
jgi:hypothetical protein